MQKSGQLTIDANRPWWEQLSNLSFFGMFLLAAIPETVIGEPYIGPIPVIFWIFYLGSFGLLLELMISKATISLAPFGLSIVGVLLTVNGLINGSEMKWIAIDLSSFGGIIIGLIWVNRRQSTFLIDATRKLLLGVLLLLLLALAGLLSGWIVPERTSGRLYTYSIFRATALLSMLLPCISASIRYRRVQRYPDWILPAGIALGYGLIIVSSLITATRSVLLGGVFSLILTTRLLVHGKRAKGVLFIFGFSLMIYTLLLTGFIPQPNLGALGERLSSTKDLAQEERWLEIEMLLSQLPDHVLWTGLGFGSRFESPVRVGDTNLAISPHLAIFTFLQKGGIPLFFLIIVGPYLFLSYRLFRGKKGILQLAASSGALMYLLMSSMSSGWEFYNLFLYGCLMGIKTDL